MKYSLSMVTVLCVALAFSVFAQEEPAKPENGSTQIQQNRERRQQASAEAVAERLFKFAKNDKEKLTLVEYKAARSNELVRMKERMGDRYNAEAAEKRITDAFKRYDKDAKGYITKEELKSGIEADRKAALERITNNNNRQRPQNNNNNNRLRRNNANQESTEAAKESAETVVQESVDSGV